MGSKRSDEEFEQLLIESMRSKHKVQTLELELKQLREETEETTKALMKKNAKLTSELRSSMLPPPHPGKANTQESAAQPRKDSRASTGDESASDAARLRGELAESQEE